MEPTPVGDEQGPSSADAVTALLRARETGQRVEDLSRRDEFTRVYANPDGSWTNEIASGPESVLDDSGQWRDIDTTLVERDGVLVPRAASTDLELSDGGGRTFAAMTRDGHDLAWHWDSPLPAPIVDGSTATYPDAIDGGDLVVTATATGFTHDVVLRERPDAAVVIEIPIVTDGGDLVEGASGDLKVTDPDGHGNLLTAPAPVMWDGSGSSEDTAPDAVSVDASVGETAAGTPELTLSPDPEFLNAPDTVYPVTIDPSFSNYPTGDTWVANATPSSQESSQELRVGTPDAGTTKSRSFVRFNNLLDSLGSNVQIKSASLVLRNFASSSCTSSTIEVAQVAEAWTLSSISWTNMPSMSSRNQATFAPAKGYDASCPADDATWDVTGIVNDWFTGVTTNKGLRIKATDETVTRSYRRYRSADYTNIPANQPHINVTYNTPPGVPFATPDGASSWFNGYLTTTTPKFLAVASDADAQQTKVRIEVSATQSGAVIASCDSASAAPGTTLTCTSAPALPFNTTVYMHAKSWDGSDWSGWSDWLALKTPASPVLQSPSPWTITPCATTCDGPIPVTGSLTPTLAATAIDPGSSALSYTFTVRDSTSPTTTVASGTISTQSPGTAAKWPVPAGLLVRDHQYDVQVKVSDLLTPDGVSSWSSFRVSPIVPPSAPGGWGISPCTAPCPTTNPSVPSTQPTMTATSTDDDTTTLDYSFEVRDALTQEPVVSGTTSKAQGQPASWSVPAANLVPGTQYEAQVTVSDRQFSPVAGGWHTFLVTDEDDEADPTVVVPEVPIESATEPPIEATGDSDTIDDLPAKTPAGAFSHSASFVAGSWSSAGSSGSENLVGIRSMSSDASVAGTGVGVDVKPVDQPTDGGPPSAFELTFGPGASGKSSSGGTAQQQAAANAATETATTDGLAVRLNTQLLADTFAGAFGGSWDDRLQVIAYPACYDTTPEAEGCSQGYVVPAVNDEVAQTLTFTAPPVKATGQALTATAAGLATAGNLGSCYPDLAETAGELESDDLNPDLTDDLMIDTDGTLVSGLEGNEDLESVDPTPPAISDGSAPVALPATAGDEDLDANDDGVEDEETGPDTSAEQPFVDSNPPAPGQEATKGYGMAPNAPAGCRGMVLRVAATAGSYAQPPSSSTVNPSGSWQVGEGSGEFSWNYPIAMPPGIGGESPSLALSYSSASVDGMTTADNAQGSAAGLGWTMEPGYISRTYRSCAKDGDETKTKGDLCWRTNSNHQLVNELSLSLAGHDTQLVRDTSGDWRLADDPGWRVTSSGTNADREFAITDTAGTTYHFGNRTGANSVWTVPVYGNDSGEPCHTATAKDSFCQQPWRWSLESVTTADGDSIKYAYATETNYYKRWASTLTSYDAAGQLTQIDYGFARGGSSDGHASVTVKVDSTARCTLKLENPGADCDTDGAGDTVRNGPRQRPSIWPDVPTDLICTAGDGTTCDKTSPSFFSRRRYSTITTSTGSGDVDRYTLGHTMPDPDKHTNDEPNLWLSKIEHVGLGGSDTTSALVTQFWGVPLANRVTGVNGARQYRKFRLAKVLNETGGRVIVTYGHSEGNNCTAANVKVKHRWQQDLECFAQQYTPPGKKPVWEWYHKYVVRRLWVGDDTVQLKGAATGQKAEHSPGAIKVIDYVYDGKPAWRFDTSENIPLDDRAWNDWRGYATTEIRTRLISGSNNVLSGSRSIRKVVRYRGMADTRRDTAGASFGDVEIATKEKEDQPHGLIDRRRFAGRVIEETLYEGGANAKWSTRIYHGYKSLQTAKDDAGHYANMVNENLTRTYTRVATPGADTFRSNDVRREVKTIPTSPRSVLNGAVISVVEEGTLAAAADAGADPGKVCTTTTWAASGDSWIRAPRTVLVKDGSNCETLRSRVTNFYDDAESSSDTPEISKGRVTKVVTALSSGKNATTTSKYDIYGRPTKTTDARGLATDYSYNDWGTAPSGVTAGDQFARTYSTTTSSPSRVEGMPIITRSQLEPSRGLVTKSIDENGTKSIDENGKVTTYAYDGLGRVTGYRSPVDQVLGGTPTRSYDYAVNTDRPSVLTTTTRRGDKTYAYVDGWGRTIETQRPATAGDGKSGRLVSTTRYDGLGLPVIEIPEVYNTKKAGSSLLNAAPGSVKHYVSTDYDFMGRAIKVTQHTSNGATYSSTTTDYKGDRVVATNARGGRTITSFDLNGNPWKVDQYDGDTKAHTATYQYSGTDQLLSISSKIGGVEQSWTYEYDLAGRRTTATDPDTGTTSYTYHDDQPGNDAYTTVTSPGTGTSSGDDITIRTDYDRRGRPIKLSNTSGSSATTLAEWAYDTATNGSGRLAKETSYNSVLGTYTRTVDGYDANGNPTRVNNAAGANGEYRTGEAYTYKFDQLATITYDAVKDPSGTDTILPQTTVNYDYTPTNAALWHITATTGSTNTWYLANVAYNNDGTTQRIESADKADLGTVAANSRRLARGYRWNDPLGRLSQIGFGSRAFTYAYDQTGNPTRINVLSDPSDNNSAVTSWCYGYDQLNRLTTAKTGTGASCVSGSINTDYRGGTQEQDLAYTYDGDRLRTAQSSVRAADGTTTTATSTYNYVAPARADQVASISTSASDPFLPKSTTLTYDASGRVAQQDSDPTTNSTAYTYNPDGTLAKTTYPCPVTSAGTARLDFAYDSSGIRTGRKLTGCNSPDSTVINLGSTELTTNGATTTARRHFTTPAGTPLAIQNSVAVNSASSKWTWLLGDQQNTIRLTRAQDTGAVTRPTYLPFGDPVTTEVAPALDGERGYLNKTHDPNGELRLDHRSYNPTLNILTTPDPLLTPSDPQTLNPYAYSRNNPINLSDPSGLDPNPGLNPEYTGPIGFDRPPHPYENSPNGEYEICYYGCAGHPNAEEQRKDLEGTGISYHDAAPFLGMITWVGPVFDLADGASYASEGDYGNAAFSILTAVPVLGDAGGLTRFGVRHGDDVADLVRTQKTVAANAGTRLDWSLVSKAGETRAAHVALHEAENASKLAHGVFIGDSQTLTNEAWSIAQARGITPISEGGVDIYRVPMGRNVGYAGGANAGEMSQVPHRTIEIITRGGTNELITAYPVPLG